jgi:hypothetical protein
MPSPSFYGHLAIKSELWEVQLQSLLVDREWIKALESPLWWTRRGILVHFEQQFVISGKEVKDLANCLSQFCQQFIKAF